MNHEARCELAFPVNDAVVRAGANERVEYRVLVRLVCDVSERAIHTSTRRHGDLRHGTKLRRLNKLCEIRRARDLVGRLRIVVRPVKGMAPWICALRGRAGDGFAVQDRARARSQHAQQFLFRRATHERRVGNIVAQANSVQPALLHKNLLA